MAIGSGGTEARVGLPRLIVRPRYRWHALHISVDRLQIMLEHFRQVASDEIHRESQRPRRAFVGVALRADDLSKPGVRVVGLVEETVCRPLEVRAGRSHLVQDGLQRRRNAEDGTSTQVRRGVDLPGVRSPVGVGVTLVAGHHRVGEVDRIPALSCSPSLGFLVRRLDGPRMMSTWRGNFVLLGK